MPVVIHELVITAEVAQRSDNAAPAVATPSLEREELIRECTEQVLKLLERQHEK